MEQWIPSQQSSPDPAPHDAAFNVAEILSSPSVTI